MQGYIYYIINTINDKRYVGKTINLKHRLECHYSDLKNNKHHSHKLQRAFNKYGWDNFKIEWKQVDISNEEELNILEISEIQKFDSYTNGYNETLGGDGNKTIFDWNQSVLIYNLCKRYKGVNRKIAQYYNCDHTVIDSLGKNQIFSQVEYDEKELENLIKQIGITSDNLIENYIPHNNKKLDHDSALALLSVSTFSDRYEKTLCDILNITSKASWRLKNGLIYKEYFNEFQSMSKQERQKLYEESLIKYNIEKKYSERQRKGVKNPLTQEQVNYILNNKNKISKAQIARDLNISIDRVRNVCNGNSYKDLITNYYSSNKINCRE